MAVGEPLNLPSVRKEQRRVAALLQVDVETSPRHKRRRKPLAGEMFWCSHLDPEGKHRDPALDYIRQAFYKDPKMTLDDLKRGFRYVKEKNDELFKRRNEDARDGGAKKDNRKGLGSKSVDFDERTKHRDKEHEYKNIRNNLSKSLDGLKLPSIKDTNRSGRNTKDSRKKPVHVRLPKEEDDARVNERRNSEFLRRKAREKMSRGVRRKGRRGRFNYDGDSALEDMSDDEYPSDPMTLLSDSGMAGTPSEGSEVEPYLRLSHGINPNPGGDDFMKDRKDDQHLMKITSLLSDKRFCSCGSSEQQPVSCPECRRKGKHSKTCSRRFRDAGERTQNVRDNPRTLISEREQSQRCLNCGKVMKNPRDISDASGMGRSWSRDSSESSGSFRVIRSSSESRIGSAEKGYVVRSRSVSPQGGRKVYREKSSSLDLLNDLERKLREGVFDYDINVRSVDDIDQTLRLPIDGKDASNAYDPKSHMRKTRSKIDMYREAYVKALSVARSKMLPSEPWMLGNRTSRAFVYSYYQQIPRRKQRVLGDGDEVEKGGGQRDANMPPKIIKKRGAEMKMIFGSVKPDDYLPGGPKNPFEPNPLAYIKHERRRKPEKGVIGRRRVQEAKPALVKGRKVGFVQEGKA